MTKRQLDKTVKAVLWTVCIAITLCLVGINTQLTKVKEENTTLKNSVKTLGEKRDKLKKDIETANEQNKSIMKNKADMEEQLNNLKQTDEAIRTLVDNPEDAKYAYLTFDDGPSENTEKILDILKDYNAKATFFVVGTGDTSLYDRIVNEGHTIALHSNTHEYSEIYADVDSFMNDLHDLSNKVVEETGVETKFTRFPGGSINGVSAQYGGENILADIKERLKSEGYTWFDWNVDSQDAAKSNQDKQVIVESVLEGLNGNKQVIVLMHDAATKDTTVEALPEIIEGLKEKGYLLKGIEEETKPIVF